MNRLPLFLLTALLLGACEPDAIPPRRAPAGAPFRSGVLPVALEKPVGWHIEERAESLGHVDFTTVVLSNVDFDFQHPKLGPGRVTSAWDLRDLPDEAVVVQVEQGAGFEIRSDSTSRFPLSLSRFQEMDIRPDHGMPDDAWWMPVRVEGHIPYAVRVWFGGVARADDRELANQVIASIRFEK